MTHKTIIITDAKALIASVEAFSSKYNLGWDVESAAQSVLNELEDSINKHGDGANIEPAPLKRHNGYVITLDLNDLKGVIVEEVEVD